MHYLPLFQSLVFGRFSVVMFWSVLKVVVNRRWQLFFHKRSRRMHAIRKSVKRADNFTKSNTVSVLVSIKFNLIWK